MINRYLKCTQHNGSREDNSTLLKDMVIHCYSQPNVFTPVYFYSTKIISTTLKIIFYLTEIKISFAKADPAPARRARAPCLNFFYGCIFGNFDFITRINFIVINMQCLQYVFYSLFSLQKHRVSV